MFLFWIRCRHPIWLCNIDSYVLKKVAFLPIFSSLKCCMFWGLFFCIFVSVCPTFEVISVHSEIFFDGSTALRCL